MSTRRVGSNWFYAIPVLGWVARDVVEGDADNIWYLLAAVLSLWGIAILSWGMPALYLPAVALAPLVMIFLVLMTRG